LFGYTADDNSDVDSDDGSDVDSEDGSDDDSDDGSDGDSEDGSDDDSDDGSDGDDDGGDGQVGDVASIKDALENQRKCRATLEGFLALGHTRIALLFCRMVSSDGTRAPRQAALYPSVDEARAAMSRSGEPASSFDIWEFDTKGICELVINLDLADGVLDRLHERAGPGASLAVRIDPDSGAESPIDLVVTMRRLASAPGEQLKALCFNSWVAARPLGWVRNSLRTGFICLSDVLARAVLLGVGVWVATGRFTNGLPKMSHFCLPSSSGESSNLLNTLGKAALARGQVVADPGPRDNLSGAEAVELVSKLVAASKDPFLRAPSAAVVGMVRDALTLHMGMAYAAVIHQGPEETTIGGSGAVGAVAAAEQSYTCSVSGREYILVNPTRGWPDAHALVLLPAGAGKRTREHNTAWLRSKRLLPSGCSLTGSGAPINLHTLISGLTDKKGAFQGSPFASTAADVTQTVSGGGDIGRAKRSWLAVQGVFPESNSTCISGPQWYLLLFGTCLLSQHAGFWGNSFNIGRNGQLCSWLEMSAKGGAWQGPGWG